MPVQKDPESVSHIVFSNTAIIVPDLVIDAYVDASRQFLPENRSLSPDVRWLAMQRDVRSLYEPIDFLTEIGWKNCS
jgi:hypothetical protein